MILFTDLPDEISVLINEYANFDNYRAQFNDVMTELKSPNLKTGKYYMRSNSLFYTHHFSHLNYTFRYWVDFRGCVPQIIWYIGDLREKAPSAMISFPI